MVLCHKELIIRKPKVLCYISVNTNSGHQKHIHVRYIDIDMPQHIVVEMCKSYLPGSSLEVSF